MFLWIFVLFLGLMVVTEHFFCPALEVISDFFKLPENVAGATLLSFGNGAPDFFTQLAAIATVRVVHSLCMMDPPSIIPLHLFPILHIP